MRQNIISFFHRWPKEERTSQGLCRKPVAGPRRQLMSPAFISPTLTTKSWYICFIFLKTHNLSVPHKVQTKLKFAFHLELKQPSCKNLWNFKMRESVPYVSTDFEWDLKQNLRPQQSLKFLHYYVYDLRFWFSSYIEMFIPFLYSSPLLFVSAEKQLRFCFLSSNPACYCYRSVGWRVLYRKSHSVGFQN